MSQLFAEVAVPVAVDTLFTYSVPPELSRAAKAGVRVVVPFGKRTLTGFIVAVTHRKPDVPNIKSILDIIDAEPILSDELLYLTKWIADYYFAPLGEVLKTVLVQGSFQAGKRRVTLTLSGDQSVTDKNVNSKQMSIIRHLQEHGSLSISQIQTLLKAKSISKIINDLAERGIVRIEEELPKQKGKPKFEQVIELSEPTRKQWWEWLDEHGSSKRFAKQIAVIKALLLNESPVISVTDLLKNSHSSLSSVTSLARKKLITISKREVKRAQAFDTHEPPPGAQNIVLNVHQQSAFQSITEAITKKQFHAFLLHGVTGSGKTQVYIDAIRETLNRSKTAIMLVPEIALTPQIVQRFRFHFGEKVAVMHSRMSLGERYDTWRAAHEGKCSIVIGPRSAVFAPLRNIGLIVVDEEQEPSYKQFDQTPRYHARDVALVRAQKLNAVVVLGSATPSFESYANALSGKFTLLELPERVDNAQLPVITIVDMTEERKKKLEEFRASRKEEFKTDAVQARASKRKFEFGSISNLLKEHIEDRLQKKEGIILLQNRRGFAPFVECPDCGYVEMCDNCQISLTYHLTKKHLRCHYCGMVKQPPDVCPQCSSTDIQYRGIGTQKVEEELTALFPQARIARMDLDTTTSRGAHEKILKKFSDGDADILLGTQMVAKGLDFSRVTLVGVISADTQMLLPDFRSAERTFQLLTQVAGRAGRSALAGEVVIQTHQPKHEALYHVLTHDFKSFYDEEKELRTELRYPPGSRLILIEFKGKNENEVMNHAQNFAGYLKRQNQSSIILGPSSAVLSKLKGNFRWHIVLKSKKETDPSGHQLHRVVEKALQSYRTSPMGKSRLVQVGIDVDPVGMM